MMDPREKSYPQRKPVMALLLAVVAVCATGLALLGLVGVPMMEPVVNRPTGWLATGVAILSLVGSIFLFHRE